MFPRSEITLTLVASCPEEAFMDLIANLILRVTTLPIAIKIVFLDSVFDRLKIITHFPVNPFIKTSLQGFHIHRIFLNS